MNKQDLLKLIEDTRDYVSLHDLIFKKLCDLEYLIEEHNRLPNKYPHHPELVVTIQKDLIRNLAKTSEIFTVSPIARIIENTPCFKKLKNHLIERYIEEILDKRPTEQPVQDLVSDPKEQFNKKTKSEV